MLREGIPRVDAEVDSQILVHVLEGKVQMPWTIAYEIRMIREVMVQMDCRLMHTYRENTKCADFLANLGCAQRK